MRGGLVVGARIVCDAMRCARAGCIRAVRCAAQDAMRGPMCCELVAMQCAAMHGMRSAGRCADCLRCNTLRAGWLHSRGAGGAMLLTEGFLGWGFLGKTKGFIGLRSTSIRSTFVTGKLALARFSVQQTGRVKGWLRR
jgi:hypothetical protein